MTRPHLKIAELTKVPLSHPSHIQNLLNDQRRRLRARTIKLVIFQMFAIGALMFTGRFFAAQVPSLAWVNGWLPWVAQGLVVAIWTSGILYAFRRENQ